MQPVAIELTQCFTLTITLVQIEGKAHQSDYFENYCKTLENTCDGVLFS